MSDSSDEASEEGDWPLQSGSESEDQWDELSDYGMEVTEAKEDSISDQEIDAEEENGQEETDDDDIDEDEIDEDGESDSDDESDVELLSNPAENGISSD